MGRLAPGLRGQPPGAGGAGGGHGLDDGVAQRQGGAHAGPGDQMYIHTYAADERPVNIKTSLSYKKDFENTHYNSFR